MPFEKFENRYARLGVKLLRVGLTRQGMFSLNKIAFSLLGQPTHVVYLFDQDSRTVGIRVSPPDVPNAYKTRQIGYSTTYHLSAVALCKKHGIDYKAGPFRFCPKPELQDGMLVFELGEV